MFFSLDFRPISLHPNIYQPVINIVTRSGKFIFDKPEQNFSINLSSLLDSISHIITLTFVPKLMLVFLCKWLRAPHLMVDFRLSSTYEITLLIVIFAYSGPPIAFNSANISVLRLWRSLKAYVEDACARKHLAAMLLCTYTAYLA